VFDHQNVEPAECATPCKAVELLLLLLLRLLLLLLRLLLLCADSALDEAWRHRWAVNCHSAIGLFWFSYHHFPLAASRS
jgi:hypothetical protein